MPESRKRPGHHPHKENLEIPRSQRVKGRVIWAVLLAVFGVLFAYFGAGENFTVLAIAAIVSASVGYAIGKAMEKDV